MSIASRGAYRTWQAWQALRAGPLSPEAQQEVSDLLTERQLALFVSQPQAGQQHGYRVMRTLVDAGHDDPGLLVAALLHDVGKSRVTYTWLDRVKVVLGRRLAPNLVRKWARGEAQGWTRAFVVKARHAEWGAEALAAAGGSELSVSLVRRHQDPIVSADECEEDRLLALLQWADDKN